MTPEQNTGPALTRELGVVAGSVQAPPAPAVADLVRQARSDVRRRHRRTVAVTSGLVAAAVVGAVLAGSRLGDQDASPTPAPQPTGTPTALPSVLPTGEPLRTWVDDRGRLHLDGATFSDEIYANAQTTGDLTTAATGEYDGGDTAVFLGTTRVGTLRDVYGSDIKVSPGRRVLAWVAYRNPQRTRLAIAIARVSETGVTELGRLTLDSLARDVDDESHESLIDVTDDGSVRYGGVLGGHTWTPGSAPRPADTSDLAYGPQGFPRSAEDVRPNASGTWGAWQTDEVLPRSPDDAVTYTSVTVQQPRKPATRHRFDLSRYAYANIVFWETDTEIVLYADRRPPGEETDGEYLRCDVVAHTCEVAPEP